MPTSPQTHSNSLPPPWIDLPWNNTTPANYCP
jgi:hypothetical protein